MGQSYNCVWCETMGCVFCFMGRYLNSEQEKTYFQILLPFPLEFNLLETHCLSLTSYLVILHNFYTSPIWLLPTGQPPIFWNYFVLDNIKMVCGGYQKLLKFLKIWRNYRKKAKKCPKMGQGATLCKIQCSNHQSSTKNICSKPREKRLFSFQDIGGNMPNCLQDTTK